MCFSIGVEQSCAQDLGDAARKERARKESQPKRSKHVYTEHDLARPEILTPEDRERFQASQKDSAPINAQKTPAAPGDGSPGPQLSLGEAARQNRLQKQAGQARESAHQKYSMPVPSPALASPVVPKLPASRLPVPELGLRLSEPPRAVQLAPHSMLHAPMTVNSASHEVRVRRGDSLWKVAQQRLGKGSRWPELLAVNPWIGDPNLLVIGSRIALPHSSTAPQTPSKIRVRNGDSLWSLARAHFGRGGAWTCIAQANPQLREANQIYPDEELILPSGCTP